MDYFSFLPHFPATPEEFEEYCEMMQSFADMVEETVPDMPEPIGFNK